MIILILSSVLAVSCGSDPSIAYSRDRIYVNIGYTYIISSGDINIKNSSSECEIISLDESIAQVSGFMVVPKSEGETTIRIRLVDNYSIYCDVRLIVTNITFVENASIRDNKVYINMSSESEKYNPITYSNDCNEIPEVSYNNKIIDYDYLTGKISPKALGETTVIVLFRDCNVSFKVYVIDKIFTKNMEINDCTVVEGYSGKFSFNIFPDNANTYSFFVQPNDYISVTSDGSYRALKCGEVTVYCEYSKNLTDSPILLSFKVTIIEELSDISISIVNSQTGSSAGQYLLEDKYIIRIVADNLTADNIRIVGATLVSDISSDSDGIFAEFYFKNTGANEIKVEVNFDGYTPVSTTTKTCVVKSISDIEVGAKWGSYTLYKSSDEKYHIYLDNGGNPNKATYLIFRAVLDGSEVSGIKVFDITAGGRQEMSSTTFDPTEVGEYTFAVEFRGASIGSVTVVVDN